MDDANAEEDEEDNDLEEDDTLTSSVDRETAEHRIQVLGCLKRLLSNPNCVNTVICTCNSVQYTQPVHLYHICYWKWVIFLTQA